MKIIGIALILFISSRLNAAVVDTVNIYSDAMKKTFKCVVIQPKKQGKKKAYPVVYLLHGYEGWYSNWIVRVPELKTYADQYQLIIVCPEGHKSSWYFDSPVDSTMRYETYVGKEVPAYIDKHYPTIKNRKARVITGLSMGGHGALFIAIRHAKTFGACGSMSGGMDMQQFRHRYDVMKRLGDSITNAVYWKNYSIINLVENMPADSLAIIIDCGIDDFMYPGNKALHEKMLTLKIPHEYIERPGNHSWDYWRNAVKFQLFYFSNYFKSQIPPKEPFRGKS